MEHPRPHVQERGSLGSSSEHTQRRAQKTRGCGLSRVAKRAAGAGSQPDVAHRSGLRAAPPPDSARVPHGCVQQSRGRPRGVITEAALSSVPIPGGRGSTMAGHPAVRNLGGVAEHRSRKNTGASGSRPSEVGVERSKAGLAEHSPSPIGPTATTECTSSPTTPKKARPTSGGKSERANAGPARGAPT